MGLKSSLTFGFSIAPLSGAFGYAIVALFYYVNATSKVEYSLGEWFMTVAFFLVPASYVASLAAGIPLIFILKRFNRLSFWWVTLPAVLLGAIILVSCLFILLVFGGTIEGNAWF